MNGIINVYKPKGITSHGVVSRLRRILNMKKIGHTGTLDPNVTGVLPVCIGKATRVSEFLLDSDKEYIGELTLGIKTDSQDGDGVVIGKRSIDVDKADILKVFENYIGEIEQIPPMYSAVRHKGKKLYELAREGIEVERKPRKSYIYDLDVLNIDSNKVLFRIACSKGTYVRTICNDIGDDLGSFGYMSHLIRTAVDPFKIEEAYSLEYIEELVSKDDYSFILPTDKGVLNLERIDIEDRYYEQILNGMRVPINMDKPSTTLHRIYCKEDFIGVGTIISGREKLFVQMNKVLI